MSISREQPQLRARSCAGRLNERQLSGGTLAGPPHSSWVRYFFHLHNDVDCRDDEGRELIDSEAAKAAAIDEAREMASESVRKGHLDLSHYIAVDDEAGTLLFKTTFGEAVKVTGSFG